ncbi:MAG: hypothetical protein ACLQVK_25920, partial [Acidimicrobiales bacterium]
VVEPSCRVTLRRRRTQAGDKAKQWHVRDAPVDDELVSAADERALAELRADRGADLEFALPHRWPPAEAGSGG